MIFGVSGWKQSGKDTMADILEKEYGFTRVSFAGILKDMVAQEYDIERLWCDDPTRKEYPLLQYPVDPKDDFTSAVCKMMRDEFKEYNGQLYWTPRALCILKGSVNRSITSKYWTSRAIDFIKLNQKLGLNNFIITDMRYRSETVDLSDAFGSDFITIRINRFDDVDTNDPSERDLDNHKFDHVIENRTGYIRYQHKIHKLMKGLGQHED